MTRRIFVDTGFYAAFLLDSDSLHAKAHAVGTELRREHVALVTSDGVIAEVLAFFSKTGPCLRGEAARLMRGLLDDPNIEVVEQTRSLVLRGLARYTSRRDKTSSLADCISMEICDDRGIRDVLTHDDDFTQERYTILL